MSSRPQPESTRPPLRVLIVEDRDDDEILLLRELTRGYDVVAHVRVDTIDALRSALTAEDWQVVVSDFSLPRMTAHDVLRVVSSMRPDIPCIVVSGTISEEAAVDVLRAGARDFVVKERMARLLPAIGRELRESVERRRRWEAESKLQETRERMQFALESVGIGTWERDLTSGKINWSDVMERLHGLAPGTFDGTIDCALTTLHPDDRELVAQRIEQAEQRGSDTRIEYRIVWPDGSVHWIVTIGRVFWDERGSPTRAVGVGMDITAQKQLEEQFRQAQKMESIGNLAGGIAHDFNNLLTVIASSCEMLEEPLALDAVATEQLEEIRGAAASATALTRQLLSFSRQQILMPRRLNLNEVITAFNRILRRIVEENVAVELRLAQRLDSVRIDPSQIEQVLLNLVANARDAMPDGGEVTIETANVHVDAASAAEHPDMAPGSYVLLSVSDTGSGIPPQVQGRLFEPFFTTKPPGRGTGLGLATVHGIVKQSGGHVSVQSTMGKGTTFRIYIPSASPAHAAQPASTEDRSADLMGTETVLVVEDNAQLRRLNELILRRYGYKVLLAANGAQAQRICLEYKQPIDVVVMDVVMPGDRGPVVGEWIAQHRPDTKIIYMSGYTGEALGHRIMDAGAPFLQKPFNGTRLARAIRDVLAPPRAEPVDTSWTKPTPAE